MKTIILCGGSGTRLKDETEYKPKPMINVGGKPLIWHIMKIYAHYGFNEFILALGYKAGYIKDFFLNQKAFTSDFSLDTKTHKTKFYLENRREIDNFKITFIDTGLDTLPGERILLCQNYIPRDDKYFMVTYGDGLIDLNIADLVKFHKKQATIGTICGIHPKFKYGVMKVTKKNLVSEFKEKPIMDDWANGGYMIFDKRFFKYQFPKELEHAALIRLAKKGQLSLYPHNGFWMAVDTNKELDELNKLWNSQNPPWKVWG
ncbi:NTP transferase domain-containing protein [Candidatus Gottesmanbacteria bacterium]|nr:NTP transferase domain-containing protein [Candidatus Gottesmanbacteria bacterium]